jgi:hypothetical protein
MKASPLLEMWERPESAGQPVGAIATTFALDPDFFERNCLPRFLALETTSEGAGSIDDVIAELELQQELRSPSVIVLADRSAQVERSSLLWDLLSCKVPNGYLHSKVALLMWEKATRVVIGSANLTPAGYRYNVEIALSAEVGPDCLLSNDTLLALADEIESYAGLVPGLERDQPVARRLTDLLSAFRERVRRESSRPGKIKNAAAPTNPKASPLDRLDEVWSGSRPLTATHLSAYWDEFDDSAVRAVRGVLTGRPSKNRSQTIAVGIGPAGTAALPTLEVLGAHDVAVCELRRADDEARTVHAKCLVIAGEQTVAALIGSSNHTRAGLGLGAGRRHRELNVWLAASRRSKEGRELEKLVRLAGRIEPASLDLATTGVDEDEPDGLALLPTFFGMCRADLIDGAWHLSLTFESTGEPDSWAICLPDGRSILDSSGWTERSCPSSIQVPMGGGEPPAFLRVAWDASEASWAVIADDRQSVPVAIQLTHLRAEQILTALASGKAPIHLLRDLIEQLERLPAQGRTDPLRSVETDPLKRFDTQSTLLRRGRALSKALSELERRLSSPVPTVEALQARLRGPLGPEFIGDRIQDDVGQERMSVHEGIFTIAEIALSVGRVDWETTLEHVDQSDGRAVVRATLDALENHVEALSIPDDDVSDYACLAMKEATSCLA